MGHLPVLFLIVHALLGTGVAGQPVPPRPMPLVRVFLDCNSRCDFDYLRTEITFVDWVRDRRDANVHVLVTTQETGSGGSEWVARAIGLGAQKGVDQSLTFSTQPTATSDDQRRALAQTIKLLLVRYAADTEAAARLTVGYQPSSGAAGNDRDPWDYWVFRLGANGYASGERSNSSFESYMDVSANRVTEVSKIHASVEYSLDQSRYRLSDGSTYRTVSKGFGATTSMIKSAGTHWSFGAAAHVGGSTYLNQALSFWTAPAAEYDVFPYAESTRRRLTFAYQLGYHGYRYEELTIYERMSDAFLEHRANVSLGLRQPWGTTGAVFEFRQQLANLDRTYMRVNANASVRLFKGFQFNVSGNYVRPRDQIYLVKGEATDEEILVRRRQLATSYRYWFNFGLSYSFGSVHNNVVNPRFQNVSDFH